MKKTIRQIQGFLDSNLNTAKYMEDKELFQYYDNPHGITQEQFIKILETFTLLMVNEIYEGKVFRLPNRIGTLGIRSYKRGHRAKRFDFVHYNATGEKRMMIPLWDTQVIYKMVWENRYPSSWIEDPYRFKFQPAKNFSDTLKQRVKNENITHKFYPVV